jgi:hypothetical protein
LATGPSIRYTGATMATPTEGGSGFADAIIENIRTQA